MRSELASERPHYEHFVVATTPAPGAVVTPILAGSFRKTFPAISFAVKTFSGTEIFHRLRADEYQIAITGTCPTEAGLVFEPFFYDPLELICPASFDIQGAITLKKLKTLPLIIRPDFGNVMQLLTKALKRVNIDLSDMNIVMQVYGNADVLQAVALGSGVGFVTRSILASSQYNNSIRIVPVKRFQVIRYIYIVRKKGATFQPGARLFWDFAFETHWRGKDFPYDSLVSR